MINLKRHILIILMLSLSFPAMSSAQQKIAFIIGGVDTEKSDTTMFDYDFYNLTRTLLMDGYSVRAFYNGDSKVTLDKTIGPFLKNKNFSWAPADYKKAFADFFSLRLTSEDKLAVFWIGHGSSTSDSATHGVITQSDTLMSVRSLEIVLNSKNLREAKQVVVDSTCYSGHTLTLANQNRCVITSSKADTLGYYNFLRELTKSMQISKDCWFCAKDLHSTFIRARGKMVSSSPMISSLNPSDSTLRLLNKISTYHLTVENYLYFMSSKGFCRTCYIKSFETFETQLQKVVKDIHEEQKNLPLNALSGLRLDIMEFYDLQKQIVSLANEDKRNSTVEAEAKTLIEKSKSLYKKMVDLERSLYNAISNRAAVENKLPPTDPCLSFQF